MRNLKRVLSLSLASIMLLGMMVIGSSAASDYPDVDYDNDNVEAIEVLQTIDVMTGYDDGGFHPGDEVTRAQMARIMAALMDLDYEYYSGANPFTDMNGHWAANYAAACYANGIIAGRTATTYDPEVTVTAVEAAAMLMRALGYFQNKDVDYPDGFVISTIKQAGKIDLFKYVDAKTDEPMTRNDVAQLILNTLQSGMVEPSNSSKIDVTVGDAQVSIGSTNYVYTVARDNAVGQAINKTTAQAGNSSTGLEGWILDLGEKLYDGKLKLNSNAQDVFGRPSRKWEFDGQLIGTYAKEELLVFDKVGKVTGKDLYDLLGASTLKDYDLYAYIDGVWTDDTGAKTALGSSSSGATTYFNALDLNRNNAAAVGGTGTGVRTEVYVDHEHDEVYVVVVNTYLAIAKKDYNTKDESLDITAYSLKKATIHNNDEYVKAGKVVKDAVSFTLDVEDFPSIVNCEKDDPILVQVAEGKVQVIQPAEVLEAVTISAFQLTDKVIVDGETYNYTTTASYKYDDEINHYYTGTNATNLKDRTYNVYLDAYGNLIGIEEVEAVKNYVFITGIDLNGSNRANQNADASAIFLDGTMESIKVNMSKSEWNNAATKGYITGTGYPLLNTWCTYTVSGDVYTVKEVIAPGADLTKVPDKNGTKLGQYHQVTNNAEPPVAKEFNIDSKNYRLRGGDFAKGADFYSVYGDSDTVYLTAELGDLRNDSYNYGIIKDVESISVGIENTSITVWDIDNAEKNADDKNVTGEPEDPRVSYGVYTLYNNKGIIIAAVVVGEDTGTANDLVYVSSSKLELEEDNGGSARAAGDGLWTWSRKVVRNGEEVTLYEVGDEAQWIDTDHMNRYEWYEIRTNGEGNVVRSRPVEVAFDGSRAKEYVTEYANINATVETDGVETVLYLTDGGPRGGDGFIRNKLDVKGNNTLAVTDQQGSGIHFRSNVNVVLQYWNRNVQEQVVLTGEGVDDLRDMVDIVNDYTDEGRTSGYYVSALIEDGFATTIVIYDSYNDYNYPHSGATTSNNSAAWNADRDGIIYTIPANSSNKTPTKEEILNDILRDMKWDWNPGYGGDVFSGPDKDGNYEITHNGITYPVVVDKKTSTSYTVTVASDITGGTVSVDKKNAEVGETVTVTATPESDYELVGITVTDADGKDVTVTGNTFTMPNANVTVSATFRKTSTPEQPGATVTGTLPTTGYVNVFDEDGEHLTQVAGTTLEWVDGKGEFTVGDTICIDPAEALGIYVNNVRQTLGTDGEWTVTGAFEIRSVDGYRWMGSSEVWWIPFTKIAINEPWNYVDEAEEGVSLLAYARNTAPDVDTENGEEAVDTSTRGWFLEALLDFQVISYKSVDEDTGVTLTMSIWMEEDGTVRIYGDPPYDDEHEDAWDNFFDLLETDDGSEITTVVSDNIPDDGTGGDDGEEDDGNYASLTSLEIVKKASTDTATTLAGIVGLYDEDNNIVGGGSKKKPTELSATLAGTDTTFRITAGFAANAVAHYSEDIDVAGSGEGYVALDRDTATPTNGISVTIGDPTVLYICVKQTGFDDGYYKLTVSAQSTEDPYLEITPASVKEGASKPSFTVKLVNATFNEELVKVPDYTNVVGGGNGGFATSTNTPTSVTEVTANTIKVNFAGTSDVVPLLSEGYLEFTIDPIAIKGHEDDDNGPTGRVLIVPKDAATIDHVKVDVSKDGTLGDPWLVDAFWKGDNAPTGTDEARAKEIAAEIADKVIEALTKSGYTVSYVSTDAVGNASSPYEFRFNVNGDVVYVRWNEADAWEIVEVTSAGALAAGDITTNSTKELFIIDGAKIGGNKTVTWGGAGVTTGNWNKAFDIKGGAILSLSAPNSGANAQIQGDITSSDKSGTLIVGNAADTYTFVGSIEDLALVDVNGAGTHVFTGDIKGVNTVKVTVGGTATTFNKMTNVGTIDIVAGGTKVTFSDTVSNNKGTTDITIAAGTDVEIATTQTLMNIGTVKVSGGKLTVTGTLQANRVDITGGEVAGTGTITARDSVSVTGTGQFNITTGKVYAKDVTLSAAAIATGAGTIEATGDVFISGAGDLDAKNISGKNITISGNSIDLGEGNIVASGDMYISDAGTLDPGTSGKLEAGGKMVIMSAVTISSSTKSVKAGTLEIRSTGELTMDSGNLEAGSVAAKGDLTTASGVMKVTGDVTVSESATLTVGAGGAVIGGDVIMSGTSTIALSGALEADEIEIGDGVTTTGMGGAAITAKKVTLYEDAAFAATSSIDEVVLTADDITVDVGAAAGIKKIKVVENATLSTSAVAANTEIELGEGKRLTLGVTGALPLISGKGVVEIKNASTGFSLTKNTAVLNGAIDLPSTYVVEDLTVKGTHQNGKVIVYGADVSKADTPKFYAGATMTSADVRDYTEATKLADVCTAFNDNPVGFALIDLSGTGIEIGDKIKVSYYENANVSADDMDGITLVGTGWEGNEVSGAYSAAINWTNASKQIILPFARNIAEIRIIITKE